MLPLRLLPALCLAAAPSLAPAHCPDNFANPADSHWTFLDADNADGGAHAFAAGKLELTGKGADIFRDKNEFVAMYRADIAGDFDVSVKIEAMQNTHQWAQAGIVAANDLKDLSKGGYAAVDVGYATGYHLFYDAAAPQGQLDQHKDIGTTAFPVTLRLARKGTDFSAWYLGVNDASWQPIAANIKSLGTGADSQIGLFSTSHNTATAAKTVFDDFNCLGSTVDIAPKRSGYGAAAMTVLGMDALGRRLDVRARPSSPSFPLLPKDR